MTWCYILGLALQPNKYCEKKQSDPLVANQTLLSDIKVYLVLFMGILNLESLVLFEKQVFWLNGKMFTSFYINDVDP